jgi:phosphatidylglycerol:prolipoprotein diacylglycerol transferase
MQASPIVHHPLSYGLGPLEITGFGLAVLAAFVISQIIAQRELLRRGHPSDADAIPDLIFAAVVGTLIGGKLYYVAVLTHDWRDIFSRGGFVFWGGFMGAVALCWIVVRRKKLSFPRYADVAGICIAAGYSVGRTGCWAVGDDYGRPWNSPLAVAFPEGAPPSTAQNMQQLFGIPLPAGTPPLEVISVHPTQLYETVLGFAMFAVLWRLRDHRHAEGWLFGVYLVLAGAERFFIEFFRAKDDRFVGPFTMAQAIAVALALLGIAIMAWRREVKPGAPGIYGPSFKRAPAAA